MTDHYKLTLKFHQILINIVWDLPTVGGQVQTYAQMCGALVINFGLLACARSAAEACAERSRATARTSETQADDEGDPADPFQWR